MEYLNIGNQELYFDFDKLSEVVRIEPDAFMNDEGQLEEEGSAVIDVTKYEMFREMVGVIISSTDVIDDKMGSVALNSLPIPFKISYNTLLKYGILKSQDN
jgi:hypothetical protein